VTLKPSAPLATFAASILLLAASPPAPNEAPFTTNAAYRQLVKNWAGIKTLSSDIAVQTKPQGFLPISLTLRGHTYFEAPDKFTTVFEDVPGLLKKMVAERPSIAPPQAWPDVYDGTIVSDEGGKSTIRLVPKDAESKLDHIDATVNDTTGFVEKYDFEGKNGAATTTYNIYTFVLGHALVSFQSGVARGHGYAADVTTSFSNYEINGRLPADAFDK
jgi:hypothetical protein